MVNRSKISSFDSNQTWRSIDRLVKNFDEDRWISSRYAEKEKRLAMISLYAFNIELMKIRKSVSDESIRTIRFQWWRDVLIRLQNESFSIHHDIVWGLRQSLNSGTLTIEFLSLLTEEHADLSDNTEIMVMSQAASILNQNHNWNDHIRHLALSYADSRLGGNKDNYTIQDKVPLAIRPALNHAVLRHRYSSRKKTSSLGKRLIICKSMLSGYI